jgi:hypothetical protein
VRAVRTFGALLLLWLAGCGGRSALGIFASDAQGSGNGGAVSASAGGAGGSGGAIEARGGAGGKGANGGAGATANGGAGATASGGAAAGGAAGAANQCQFEVVTTSPAPSSKGVPSSSPVSVSWQCLAGTSADSSGWTLSLRVAMQNVAGVTLHTGPTALQFVPVNGLALSTTYLAALQRGADTLYEWSFTTQDGAWHAPEPVTTLSGIDQNFVFAVNDRGAGVIAYSEEDAGTNYTKVSTRRFDIGSGLAPQTQAVADARYSDVHSLSVGLDDARRAAVSWLEYTGKYALLAATQAENGTWQPLATVAGPGNYWIELEQLAVSAAGKRFLLWKDNPSNQGGQSDLKLADLDQLNRGPTVVAHSVGSSRGQLAFETSGGAWALWDSPVASVRHLSAAGAWADPQSLGPSNQSGARIAVSADGSALLIFPAKIGSKSSLTGWRFTPDGGWTALEALDTEGNRGTTSVSNAELAVDSFGNGLAVWLTSMTYVVSQMGGSTTYNTVSELRSQRFLAASGWSSGHDTLDLGTATEAAVALDDTGNGFAVAVSGGEVRAARWLATSGWQASFAIGEGASAAPRLVIDRSGRAAALWRSGANLIIRRFDDQ